jgi:hypothetical protein
LTPSIDIGKVIEACPIPRGVLVMEAIRLSAAVMTHPRRRAAAEALRVRHPDLDPTVVVDPDPDGPPSALRTARSAWRAVGAGATHHLVVQDDMILADGIAEHARRAAAALPDRILCLFTEWGSRTANAVRLAAFEGVSWVPVIDPYIPTAALLLPAAMARELAEFPAAESVPDDVVLLEYCRTYDVVPLVCVPNLAEHVGSESLVGNDVLWGPRRSALYAGRLDRIPALDSTVAEPTSVPHLLVWDGYPVSAVPDVRDDPTRTHWRSLPTYAYLASRGVTVDDLFTWFAGATADLEADAEVRRLIGRPLLFQCWVTLLAYGVAAADLVPDEAGLAERLRRPLVREGLATLAPGALQRFVPVAVAERLRDLLDPFVTSTIRLGHAVCGDLAARAPVTLPGAPEALDAAQPASVPG